MNADVSYNDFTGTVAADISDVIGAKFSGDDIISIAKYFKIDDTRFKVVGISIYGVKNFQISLICVDLNKTTPSKEHIVNMSIDIENENEILKILFKRINFVLYNKFDKKYSSLVCDEEVRFTDFHHNEKY